MPKVKPGEVPVNVDLPQALVERVKKYQHKWELDNRKDAFRELLEQALDANGIPEANEEAPPK